MDFNSDTVERIGYFNPNINDTEVRVHHYAVYLSDEYIDSIVDGTKLPDFIRDEIESQFTGEHCQHDYDCCGNWYPSAGKIINYNSSYNFVIVEQFFTLNV